MTLAELDLNKFYTYADYIKWQIEERVELIKGKIFEMAAPKRVHQELTGYIHVKLFNFLEYKSCKVYEAPFDVRLPRKSKEDKDIITVLQPDICVICDLSKLDDAGCLGAPDIIVEVLSPGNNNKELRNKYDVYEESGVKEYWIVSPQDHWVKIHVLTDGKFKESPFKIDGDIISSAVLDGFSLDVTELFKQI